MLSRLFVSAPPLTGQLRSIQYLRAIVATMVVVFHTGTQAQRLGYSGDWPTWLSRGVDVFFVISGFVMWTTTRSRPIGPVEFYKRRILRIVPLYWLLTSVSVVLMVTVPGVVKSGRFDIYHVAASYLFIPAVHPFTGAIEPVLAPGWTLNYEMFFYAIFGALLLAPVRWQLVGMGACLSAAMLLGAVFTGHVMLQFYGGSIILEFGFGMALAAVYLRGWGLAPGFAGVVLIAGLVALALTSDLKIPRALASGLPALAMVTGCLPLEALFRRRKVRILQDMGDASYSLYLSHGIVLSACGQIAVLLGFARFPGIIPAFTVAGCIAAGLAALMIHRAVEIPLVRLFSARKEAGRVTPAEAISN